MKTVVGLFDNYGDAQKAARDLEAAGISHNDISIVANNANDQYATAGTTTGTTTHPNLGSETATGAVEGGIAGLLIGLAPFVIPGLGAIAAAGWLTMTLVGAGVGAAVGLVGALTGVGVPEEDAALYNEGVRRGGTLLAIKVSEEMAQHVADILDQDGAVNIDKRGDEYRRDGTVTPAYNSTATPAYNTAPVATVGSGMAGTAGTAYDTTYRSNVEVDPVSGHTSRSHSNDYETYESDFRNNYQSAYGNLGGSYEQYAPAYRYGYDMSADPRYRGRDWNTIEPEIQRDWETRQPGTWERFKDSVRYAWDKTTGAERGGIKTGGHAIDGTPDTRGITEKISDAVTGDHIDDKTGKVV